ncbi:retropepsin-like aspartic protease [Polluticoccus soli]|uniref:retropepsin-like aspartic protease n=1 Tax=Polluticoccus soli TaxID=3034150 RepID=UPI0023E1D62E|nr:retropepsin-like aspartic protease [Flavipsychrobacter sp. JY13-12]
MKTYILTALFLFANIAYAQDSQLQIDLDNADYFSLRDQLAKRNATLDAATRLYYSAFVDNAFNRNDLAIARVDSFLQLHQGTWTDNQTVLMEQMLMDSYVKTYQYGRAANIGNNLLTKIHNDSRPALLNSRNIWGSLKDVPPQTVFYGESFTLPFKRNQVNLWEIPVKVNNSDEEEFIFDTGANISTISETYAQKLRLRPLDTRIDVIGGQGQKITSGLAVADSLQIGSALIRNVVFIVMPDDKLYFPQIRFTIKGIIGFPVISALKEIRISREGTISVSRTPDNTRVQNMALNQLTPLVQTKNDKNETLILKFDTGAAQTDLYSNYFAKYKDRITTYGRSDRRKLVSAGGGRYMPVFVLDRFRLHVGDDIVNLKDIAVYTYPEDISRSGSVYGNMGQDVISQFDEMAINFEHMYVDFK